MCNLAMGGVCMCGFAAACPDGTKCVIRESGEPVCEVRVTVSASPDVLPPLGNDDEF